MPTTVRSTVGWVGGQSVQVSFWATAFPTERSRIVFIHKQLMERDQGENGRVTLWRYRPDFMQFGSTRRETVTAREIVCTSTATKRQKSQVQSSFPLKGQTKYYPHNPADYRVQWGSILTSMLAPIFTDSGFDSNFINLSLFKKQGLTPYDFPLISILSTAAPLVKLLIGMVNIPWQPHRTINCHIFPAMSHLVMMGHSWFIKHNPNFDWVKWEAASWSPACFGSCFNSKLH